MGLLFHKDTVKSTNTSVKEYYDLLDKNDYIALYSDVQEAGRGRLGRTWESLSDDNIYLSIMMKRKIENINFLTIIAGVSVCEVLEDIEGLEPKIKWPNDIFVNGKKLSGILTECSYSGSTLSYFVIGIGVNLNNESFKDFQDIATSVYKETKKKYDKVEIIKKIIDQLNKNIDKYGNKEFDIQAYEKRIFHLKREVYFEGEKVLTKGIDDIGNLIVENQKGEELKLTFSEISIKL